LGEALVDIATAQKRANPRLVLLGVIVCAIPRPQTRLSRELVAYVERTCVDPQGQTLKFETEITRSVVLQEAQRAGQTLFQYRADHPVAEQYRALAVEMEGRLAQLQATPEAAANA
jgi:chromosome partitioning protein